MLLNILNNLKANGFYPKNILDIGAHHGNWTKNVMNIFNESNYYLIEPINYQELKVFDKVNNIKYFNILLSDCEKIVDWFEMKNTGDSIFRENTSFFKDCKILKKKTTTLHNFFPEDSTFDLIKIDTQGSEIPILKGGINFAKKASFIILEMPFIGEYNKNVPNFLEHIKFMDDLGFIPFDICELHKTNEILFQVDFIFIKKDHYLTKIIQNTINNLGK